MQEENYEQNCHFHQSNPLKNNGFQADVQTVPQHRD
jgi:hypothetical protein